ncbi:hypothetical protein KFE25_004736 [Diacronema lutheri]|uniref:SAM-dependent MTase RsmB/NOP-type domain-containing protein n=1 Tax=Diacronema lutheri TaxID=2081491 RepID=A0A8J5XP02_DIALT|nr:hypothetical protein KFE25_004736 [Diacronema lutheri]
MAPARDGAARRLRARAPRAPRGLIVALLVGAAASPAAPIRGGSACRLPSARVRAAAVDALVRLWGDGAPAERAHGADGGAASARVAMSAEKALKLALRAAQRASSTDGASAAGAADGGLCEAERAQVADGVLAVAALRLRLEHMLASALRLLPVPAPAARALSRPLPPHGASVPLPAAVLALAAEARAEALLAAHAAHAALGDNAAAELAGAWLGRAALDALTGCERDAQPCDRPAAAAALGAALARAAADAAEGADGGALWPTEPIDRVCAQHSLPRWLVLLWLRSEPFATAARADGAQRTEPGAALGAVARLGASCCARGPVVLRANALRGSRDELIAALAREGVSALPTALSPHGVRLPNGRPTGVTGGGLRNLRAWQRGLCEAQDEGSQAVALATRVAPGMRLLDLCAGNGGKTLALAAEMGGRGLIVAHDVDGTRLAQIGPRAARAGVPAGLVRIAHGDAQLDAAAADARALGRTADVRLLGGGGDDDGGAARGGHAVGAFDVVLVDAPCSSTGVLRRHPSLRWELRAEQCEHELPAVQRSLLARAAPLVALGGTLVYATCAISAPENEDVARWLGAHAALPGGVRLEPLPFGPEDGLPVRAAGLGGLSGGAREHMAWLLPHEHGTDGFFIARWRRCD